MKKKELKSIMQNFYDESNRYLYLLEEYKKMKNTLSKKELKKFKKCDDLNDLNFKIQYIGNVIFEEITPNLK